MQRKNRNSVTLCVRTLEDRCTPATAVADTFAVLHDHVLTGNVATNDYNLIAPKFRLESAPLYGRVGLTATGKFTYVPNPHSSLADEFTYSIRDVSGNSGIVAVSIDVHNADPVANRDDYDVAEWSPLTTFARKAPYGVGHNDTDTDNDPLTYEVTYQPIWGTVTMRPDGSFVYYPPDPLIAEAPWWDGTDLFYYQVTDKVTEELPAIAGVMLHMRERPKVESTVIDNSSQFQQITVKFNHPIVLDTTKPLKDTLFVSSVAGLKPALNYNVQNDFGSVRDISDDRGYLILTLAANDTSGTTDAYGHLLDAGYYLRIMSGSVRLLDAPTITTLGNYGKTFTQKFGDFNGDKQVNETDKAAFDAAYASGTPTMQQLAWFDFDHDGTLSAIDLTEFNKRFHV